MNIKRALQIPGMMSEEELMYLAELASDRELIVEIGSWMGRSARAMADNTKGKIFCVDTWQDDAYGPAPDEITRQRDWLVKEFYKHLDDKLTGNRLEMLRASSVAAARGFRSGTFDMIFIDAGHSYEEVKQDILAWRPLLREGGILCGHDLYKDGPYHPGVKQAVDELIVNYTVTGTIWVAQ